MDENEDIELTEDAKKKAVCGKCVSFGGPPHHNFGSCLVDAFGDDAPLHSLYRSHCSKYETLKKRLRAQAEMRL